MFLSLKQFIKQQPKTLTPKLTVSPAVIFNPNGKCSKQHSKESQVEQATNKDNIMNNLIQEVASYGRTLQQEVATEIVIDLYSKNCPSFELYAQLLEDNFGVVVEDEIALRKEREEFNMQVAM
jgi:predicted HTH domain antitoxin